MLIDLGDSVLSRLLEMRHWYSRRVLRGLCAAEREGTAWWARRATC